MLTILVSILLFVNSYSAHPFAGLICKYHSEGRTRLRTRGRPPIPVTHLEKILEVVWSYLATTISCTWIAIGIPTRTFVNNSNLTWIKPKTYIRRLYLMVLATDGHASYVSSALYPEGAHCAPTHPDNLGSSSQPGGMYRSLYYHRSFWDTSY